MKRTLLLAAALTLTVNSAQAGWAGQEPEMTAGEFFCGILGGLAGGKIAHAAGASDPVIFGVALLGGAVGASFCSYLRDEEQQTLIPIVNQSLETPVNGAKTVRTDGFVAYVNIRNECWRTGVNSDVQMENTCKLFEASIHRRSGEFLGRSKEWACKNEQGAWVITSENWIPVEKCNQRRASVSTGYGSSNGGSGYGSPSRPATPAVVASGPYPGSVEAPVVSQGPIALGWDARQIPRKVLINNGNGTSTQRAPQLMNRRTEIGFFGGASQDGGAVYFYLNNEPQNDRDARVHNVNDVGVECGATVFCQSRYVTTSDGREGVMRFLFRNGDAGIKTSTYWIIVPYGHYR